MTFWTNPDPRKNPAEEQASYTLHPGGSLAGLVTPKPTIMEQLGPELKALGAAMAQRRNDAIAQKLLEQERPDLAQRYKAAGLTGTAAYQQMNDDVQGERQDQQDRLNEQVRQMQMQKIQAELQTPAAENKSVMYTLSDGRTIPVTPDTAARYDHGRTSATTLGKEVQASTGAPLADWLNPQNLNVSPDGATVQVKKPVLDKAGQPVLDPTTSKPAFHSSNPVPVDTYNGMLDRYSHATVTGLGDTTSSLPSTTDRFMPPAGQPSAAAPVVATPADGGMVKVIHPDGTPGMIPAQNVAKALAQGYTLAQ